MDNITREAMRMRMISIANTCKPSKVAFYASLTDDILRACLIDNELAGVALEQSNRAAGSMIPSQESFVRLIPALRDLFVALLKVRIQEDGR